METIRQGVDLKQSWQHKGLLHTGTAISQKAKNTMRSFFYPKEKAVLMQIQKIIQFLTWLSRDFSSFHLKSKWEHVLPHFTGWKPQCCNSRQKESCHWTMSLMFVITDPCSKHRVKEKRQVNFLMCWHFTADYLGHAMLGHSSSRTLAKIKAYGILLLTQAFVFFWFEITTRIQTVDLLMTRVRWETGD